MASILGGIKGAFYSVMNGVRDHALSPDEKQARAISKIALKVLQVTAVIFGLLSVYHLVIAPSLIKFIVAPLAVILAHEIYQVAENCLEILNKAAVEMRVREDEEYAIKQLTQNTIVLGAIVDTIDQSRS